MDDFTRTSLYCRVHDQLVREKTGVELREF